MGFDISMVSVPSNYEVSYTPQSSDQPEYWRFVPSGMEVILTIMEKAGCIDLEAKVPNYPVYKGTEISKKRVEELEDWIQNDEDEGPIPTAKEREILAPLKEELRKWRSTKSEKPGKVPYFKFSSNDGWIVSPEECRNIANALRRAVQLSTLFVPDFATTGLSNSEIKEWVENWAAYNSIASGFGGYVVR